MSSEVVTATVGELIVHADLSLCVGFGDCVTEAKSVFCLDGDGVVAFVDEPTAEPADLVRACEVCPVDALTLTDSDGNPMVS